MDAVVTLTVTDCNDHPPVFSQSSYAFSIPERTAAPAADEPVYTGITVTDNDASAANTMLSFSVVGGVASTNNWFDIAPTTVSAVDIVYMTLPVCYSSRICTFLIC